MEKTELTKNSGRLRCIDAMDTVKWMLNLTGIWPLKNPTQLQVLKFILVCTVLASFLTTMVVEFCIIKNDFDKLQELFCMLLPVFLYHVKVGMMHFRKKNFFYVLDLMDSDLFNSHGDKLEKPLAKMIRSSKRISRFFQILSLLTVTLYVTYPLFDGKGLPIPLSINLGQYKYLVYFLQATSLLLSAWIVSSMDLLFMIFMKFISAQIDVLKSKLINVRQDAMLILKDGIGQESVGNLDDIIEDLLKDCVLLHRGIISVVEQLELVYSLPMLVQFISGMVLVCSCILQIITVPPGSAQFLLSWEICLVVLTQQSLYNVFGNDIIFKSNEISEACFLSEWYNCNLRSQRMLLMIMKRAKEPLAITVHKFTTVSLVSFGTMIRWAYSFVALARLQQQREHNKINKYYRD